MGMSAVERARRGPPRATRTAPDREVDAARQDDHQHAQAEQAVDDDLAEQVRDVRSASGTSSEVDRRDRRAAATKMTGSARSIHEALAEACAEACSRRRSRHRGPSRHSWPTAAHTTFTRPASRDARGDRQSSRSSVASACPLTSPTTRPCRMTTMRSLMPMISGRSEEMSRTPRPSSARRADELVDLDLGGHVDATGRLVEDLQPGTVDEPLPEDDLLLVAAAEHVHGTVQARGSGCRGARPGPWPR